MKKKITRRSFVGQMAAAGMAPALSKIGMPGSKPETPPNILWIAVEDISPFLGCYGHEVKTPHLDKLAAGGVTFDNTFMPAPVCSPCRSGMITGMMPTTLGVHNHHSSRTEKTAFRLPDSIKTLPEIFRQNGYFTFNQGKDDYNFWYDREELYAGEYITHPLYGKSGKRIVGWKDRKQGQPFFGQIQLFGGKQIYGKSFKDKVKSPIDRNSIELPPYYPDHPDIREDWAQHLESIQITDGEVGKILAELKADNLLDNTVIIFFSDHGMRLWRHKQFCYDSSLQVPLIMSAPGNPACLGKKGIRRTDLVSGLDISVSTLALAGIPVPGYMEGIDLFASDFQERESVVSVRDRCDYAIDRIRSVRTTNFRYIRNFFPDRPYMQPNYRDEWQITQLMRDMHKNGKLDPVQDKFWGKERPSEELYDIKNDPHEINNLAFDPEFREQLLKHREMLTGWICETGDQGQHPEDSANLQYMLDIWRERGVEPVNPEYDHLKTK